MKPDCIVIGAMKCGSSTICAYLEDHPEIFIPTGEPHYFSIDENYAKGHDWYESHFTGRTTERLIAEGSNSYASVRAFPDAAERMAAYNPSARLIYSVRNPVDRLISDWVQLRSQGTPVSASLETAITESDTMLGTSLYWENLSRYREFFPDNQIHVIFLEDMKRDPASVFEGLCDFLGIERRTEARRGHVNPSSGKRIPLPIVDRVNGSTVLRTLKRAVPQGLRSRLRDRFFTTRLTGLPPLPPSARDAVIDALSPDARAFLDHCGKPSDYWTFRD